MSHCCQTCVLIEYHGPTTPDRIRTLYMLTVDSFSFKGTQLVFCSPLCKQESSLCLSVCGARSLSLFSLSLPPHESQFVAPLTYGRLLIREGKREAASPLQSTCHIFSSLSFNKVALCPSVTPFLPCVVELACVHVGNCIYNSTQTVFLNKKYVLVEALSNCNGTFWHTQIGNGLQQY